MIDRLDIDDILNTVSFVDVALNISLRKFGKCNVMMILFIWPRVSEWDQRYDQP